MDQDTFESRYSKTGDIIPDNFWMETRKPEYETNILRICIDRDRTEYLDTIEKLANQTPAEKIIHGSYQNNLHPPQGFRGFVAEMWGYIATQKWLCECKVADTASAERMSDFTCKNEDVDIEVSRAGEDDSVYRIRRKVEDVFQGEKLWIDTILKENFNKFADTYQESDENQKNVEKILERIDSINPSSPPSSIEEENIRVEFKQKDTEKVVWTLDWENIEKIHLDQNGQFEYNVQRKAKKQRGDTPLVLFFNCDISLLQIKEIRDLLIGPTHSYPQWSDVIVSKHIRDREDTWKDYLLEIGALPESNHSRAPCIRPGDEGIFFQNQLENVAGLLARTEDDSCGYIPNIYTDKIDAKKIYDRVNRNMSQKPIELTSDEL